MIINQLISSEAVTRSLWSIIAIILLTPSLHGQSLERKVFSPGGSVFSHNGQEYGFTIGEPVIGTDLLTIPYLTKGFQQPDPLILLAPSVTLHDVEVITAGISLHWSASHEEQTTFYRVEYAVDAGEFVGAAKVLPQGRSGMSHILTESFPTGQILRFRITQFLQDGSKISSNEMEVWLGSRDSSWRIIPNPISGEIATLAREEALYGQVSIEIFTQFGQSVDRLETEVDGEASISLPVSGLSAGIYLLQITTASQTSQQRMIVAK